MSGTSKPTSYPNPNKIPPKPNVPVPSGPTSTGPNYGGNVPGGTMPGTPPQSGNWFSGYTGQLDTTNAQTAAMRDWVVNYLMKQGQGGMNTQMGTPPPRTQVGQAGAINTQFGTALSGRTAGYNPSNRPAAYTPYNGGTPPRVTGTPGNPGYDPGTGTGGEEIGGPFKPHGGYRTVPSQLMDWDVATQNDRPFDPLPPDGWDSIWTPPGGKILTYDGSQPAEAPQGLDRSMIRNVQDIYNSPGNARSVQEAYQSAGNARSVQDAYQSSGNAGRVQDSYQNPGDAGMVSTLFNQGQMATPVQTQFSANVPEFQRGMVRDVGLGNNYQPQAARDVYGQGTQSIDALGGQNSAFFRNMMNQLSPSFDMRRNLGLAAAKESAGNLTGSGFANRLGSSINRSLGDEQAALAQYAVQGLNLEAVRQGGDANRLLSAGQSNQGADIALGGQRLQRGAMDLQAQQSNQAMDSTFLNQLISRGGLNLQGQELDLRGQMANQASQEAYAQRGLTAQDLALRAGMSNQSTQGQNLNRMLDTARLGQTGQIANQSSEQQNLQRVMDAMRLGQQGQISNQSSDQQNLSRVMDAMRLGQQGQIANQTSQQNDLQRTMDSYRLSQQGQIANQGADQSFINQLLNQSQQGLTAQGMSLQAQQSNQSNDRSFNELQAQLDAARNNSVFGAQNQVNNQNAQNFFALLNNQATAGIAPNTVTQTSGASSLIPAGVATAAELWEWYKRRNK